MAVLPSCPLGFLSSAFWGQGPGQPGFLVTASVLFVCRAVSNPEGGGRCGLTTRPGATTSICGGAPSLPPQSRSGSDPHRPTPACARDTERRGNQRFPQILVRLLLACSHMNFQVLLQVENLNSTLGSLLISRVPFTSTQGAFGACGPHRSQHLNDAANKEGPGLRPSPRLRQTRDSSDLGLPRSARLTCGVHLPEQPPALGVEGHPRAPLQLLGCLGGCKRVASGEPRARHRRGATPH